MTQDLVNATVTRTRIVVVALAMGVAFVGAAILVISGGDQEPSGEATPIMTYIAIGLGGIHIFVRGILLKSHAQGVRRQLLSQKRDLTDELVNQRLIAAYQARTILGAALMEGSALLLVMAYFIEHQWMALAIAFVMIMATALHFPSISRLESWIGLQKKIVDDEASHSSQWNDQAADS